MKTLATVVVVIVTFIVAGSALAESLIVSITITADTQDRDGYFWSSETPVIGRASGDMFMLRRIKITGMAYQNDEMLIRIGIGQYCGDGMPDRFRMVITRTRTGNRRPITVNLTHNDRILFYERRWFLIDRFALSASKNRAILGIGSGIRKGDTIRLKIYDDSRRTHEETRPVYPIRSTILVKIRYKTESKYLWESGNTRKSFLIRAFTDRQNGGRTFYSDARINDRITLTGIGCGRKNMIFRSDHGDRFKEAFPPVFNLTFEQDWYTHRGPNPDRSFSLTEKDTRYLQFNGRYLKVPRTLGAVDNICSDVQSNDELRFILTNNKRAGTARAPQASVSPTMTWGAIKRR